MAAGHRICGGLEAPPGRRIYKEQLISAIPRFPMIPNLTEPDLTPTEVRSPLPEVGIGVVVDCLGPESKSESDYLEMCRLHTPQPSNIVRHSKSGRFKPAWPRRQACFRWQWLSVAVPRITSHLPPLTLLVLLPYFFLKTVKQNIFSTNLFLSPFAKLLRIKK